MSKLTAMIAEAKESATLLRSTKFGPLNSGTAKRTNNGSTLTIEIEDVIDFDLINGVTKFKIATLTAYFINDQRATRNQMCAALK